LTRSRAGTPRAALARAHVVTLVVALIGALYGVGFAGKTTASGERLGPLGVAMCFLPIGD